MKKIIKFLKETKFPSKKRLVRGYNALSKKETLYLVLSTIIALVSVIIILGQINENLIEEVPRSGGTITEGIVGMPTLVNPVLAVSEADKDLSELVYSGLLRRTPDGDLIPDLAESYEISKDGTKYTFILRSDAKFHDKVPLTVEDVIFTINKIKDPIVKSPKRVRWEGVAVESLAENEISFILKKPYASFIENMTVGILPMHLWRDVDPEEFGTNTLNTNSIGSGPYQISKVERNNEGTPTKYTLKRNKNFTLGKPYIKKIVIKSYNNEKDLVQALRVGAIENAGGLSPENLKSLKVKHRNINTMVLPRMFGLFFNSENNSTLGDIQVRKAIDKILDREKIIDDILSGYGVPKQSPIPEHIIKKTSLSDQNNSIPKDIEGAYEILEKAGWVKNDNGLLEKKTKNDTEILSFSITTGDAPELVKVANEIKNQLREFGIMAELRVYETGQLNQIIRDREYEALFFGQVVNHGSDLFAFWHSSQKKDPGLNIALFGNEKADILLNISETILSPDERSQKYIQFEDIWRENMGSVFLYSPEYIYVTDKKVHIPQNYNFINSQSRFDSVYLWYTNTDKVWKIFNH